MSRHTLAAIVASFVGAMLLFAATPAAAQYGNWDPGGANQTWLFKK